MGQPNCKQCLSTNLLVFLTLIGGTVGLSVGFFWENGILQPIHCCG